MMMMLPLPPSLLGALAVTAVAVRHDGGGHRAAPSRLEDERIVP